LNKKKKKLNMNQLHSGINQFQRPWPHTTDYLERRLGEVTMDKRINSAKEDRTQMFSKK
jgi:hypothetical protein